MTRFRLLGVLVAVSLLIAACGDDDGADADETAGASSRATVERYAR